MSFLALSGCAWISEEQKYYFKKEWNQAREFDWQRTAEDASGASELFPRPSALRAKAERDICLHKHGDQRVTSQNGISDSASSRRCVLSPYPTAGQRMKGRG